MIILREKSFAGVLPKITNSAATRANAANGIISTKDNYLLKILRSTGVAIGK